MGKFIVKRTDSGFVFHLKAANGENIGVSEVYQSEDACRKGIESVVSVVKDAAIEDRTLSRFRELRHPKFQIYKDNSDKFRFRLKASNGQEILASQAYTAKASCKNGIHSVVTNAPEAPILIEK